MKYRNYHTTPKFSEGEKVYYGDVEGVSDIPMIEAANLDDYERLFHQAVDDYLDDKAASKPKSIKGGMIATFIVALLVALAVVTCPKKEQHVQAISDQVKASISEDLGQSDNSDLSALGFLFGNVIVTPIVKNSVYVNNYILFSVGKLGPDKEGKTVSYGIFGHVFTIPKEKINEAIENMSF